MIFSNKSQVLTDKPNENSAMDGWVETRVHHKEPPAGYNNCVIDPDMVTFDNGFIERQKHG